MPPLTRLAVGYRLPAAVTPASGQTLMEAIREHCPAIGELYFAGLGEPSGRLPLGLDSALSNEEIQRQLLTDLEAASAMGIELTLLFNAACYGEDALSQRLADYVCRRVSQLRAKLNLAGVTTTSPMIAAVVKAHFPEVRTKASVNLRIDTIQAAEYVAPYFDEFYLRREYNRDLGRLREFRAWADRHGKRLAILANSGCLPYCSGQSFHDNLVAHDAEAAEVPAVAFNPAICRPYYMDAANRVRLLQSTWIRPEDTHHYGGLVDTIKLATRMHADPAQVIRAYAEGRFAGNLLDLLEPGHQGVLAGGTLDNAAFPDDWFATTAACQKDCHRGCGYCAAVLRRVLRHPDRNSTRRKNEDPSHRV
ncbi:MAG: hypothetical protein BWZ02_00380 [Lentisphaerae bacterium ADurb.BinA184]|nr:MAG: hypothetical protein BWZ02_00380 [Lentisphaerae bacterium ADurb.BinA184]